jgi:hypothetical protein
MNPTRRNVTDAEDAADRRRLAIEPPVDRQSLIQLLDRAARSTDPQIQVILADHGGRAVERLQADPDRFGWRVERVALELGIGSRQVDRLVQSGHLTPVRLPLPGNERRFDPAQVKQLATERRDAARSQEGRK